MNDQVQIDNPTRAQRAGWKQRLAGALGRLWPIKAAEMPASWAEHERKLDIQEGRRPSGPLDKGADEKSVYPRLVRYHDHDGI